MFRASRTVSTLTDEHALIHAMIGLLGPHRADFSEVNQVKFEHDRGARGIIKTILLSLQEFSIGGASRAKKAVCQRTLNIPRGWW